MDTKIALKRRVSDNGISVEPASVGIKCYSIAPFGLDPIAPNTINPTT